MTSVEVSYIGLKFSSHDNNDTSVLIVANTVYAIHNAILKNKESTAIQINRDILSHKPYQLCKTTQFRLGHHTLQRNMKLGAELKKILGIGKHVERVLILDGADVVGHRVVERLIDADIPELRVGMRTPTENEETRGVEIVPFIWEDESTYDAAL